MQSDSPDDRKGFRRWTWTGSRSWWCPSRSESTVGKEISKWAWRSERGMTSLEGLGAGKDQEPLKWWEVKMDRLTWGCLGYATNTRELFGLSFRWWETGRNLILPSVIFQAWTILQRLSEIFLSVFKSLWKGKKKNYHLVLRKTKDCKEKPSVGRLTMPRANLAEHNETHKQ